MSKRIVPLVIAILIFLYLSIFNISFAATRSSKLDPQGAALIEEAQRSGTRWDRDVKEGDIIEVPLYLGVDVNLDNIYVTSNMPESVKTEVDSYIETTISEDESKLIIKIIGKPIVENPNCSTSKLEYRLRYIDTSKDYKYVNPKYSQTTSAIEICFYPEAKNNHEYEEPAEYSGTCRETTTVNCLICGYRKSVACKQSYEHTMQEIITEPTCTREGSARCSECSNFYSLPATGHNYSSDSRRCTVCNGGFNEDYHYDNSNPTNSAQIALDMIESLNFKQYLYPAYPAQEDKKWVTDTANKIKDDYEKSGKSSKYKGEQKGLFAYIVNEYVNRNLNYQYGMAGANLDAYQVLNLIGKDTDRDGIVDQHLANCEGYTVASRDLAYELGIESYFVGNKTHSMLIAKLDNEWFVADVTQGLMLIGLEEYDKYYPNSPLLHVYQPHCSTMVGALYKIAGYDVKTKKLYETNFNDSDWSYTRTDKEVFTGWKDSEYKRNSDGNLEKYRSYYYYGVYLVGKHKVGNKEYLFDYNYGKTLTKTYEAPKFDIKSSYTVNPYNCKIKIPILNWDTYTEPIAARNEVSFSEDKKYIIYDAKYHSTCTTFLFSELKGDILAEIKINVEEHVHKYTLVKATVSKNGYKQCAECGEKITIYYPKNISLSATKYIYDGKTKTPSVTVKDSAGNTISKSNYTVTYQDGRVNVGTYKVTIAFKGNYSGTKTLTFKIEGKSILKCNISGITNKIYKEQNITPNPSITDGDKKLVKDTDYKLSYSNNINPGKATVTITGIGNYTGSVKSYFYIVPKKVEGLKATSQTTTSLKLSWTKAKGASGYLVQMYNSSNSKWKTINEVSTNSLTVTGLAAGKSYNFRVRAFEKNKQNGQVSDVLIACTKPDKPIISKVVSNQTSAKIKWSKVSGATGYEIVYSTSKDFASSKMVTTKNLSMTINNLKKNTTYYFKIRAYKIASDGKTLYGSYSATKNNSVYITPTGKKYHFDPECGGKNSKVTTLKKAQSLNLSPCQKCSK